MSAEDVEKAFERYVATQGGRVPAEAEPTSDHLSGLSALLAEKLPPFADFAIFGPYASRIAKKM
eukprot:3232626-Amphidinium_carterae.1